MNKEKIISIAVIVLLVAGIVGFAIYGKGKSAGQQATQTQVAPVAVVNGVDIPQATFDTQLAAAITSLKSQGVDTTSTTSVAAIKQQVLDNLIATELVNEGVVKAGIKASDADVQAQYDALVTQAGGADKFKAQLASANLTDAQLRANIASQLAIQAYLLKNINVASTTVTSAEIKAFYDANTKGQSNVPTLASVSDQIKQQLIQTKQQTLVNAFIAQLRAAAQITINLK